MERKPWPIILLGVFHLVEPLVKVIFYAFLWNRSLLSVLGTFSRGGWFLSAVTFFSFPLIGVAILAVRRWSLPVVIFIELLTIGVHVYNHYAYPHQFPTLWLIAFTLINLAVVTYFLLPAVRIAYLDPRVRWWAAKPRYEVNWPTMLTQSGISYPAILANLSEGGALISVPEDSSVRLEKPFEVDVRFEEYHFSFHGKILYQKHIEDRVRYGSQFQNVNSADLSRLRQLIRLLEKRKFPRRPKRQNLRHSFGLWFYGAVTQGRGLVPTYKKRASDSDKSA